MQSHEDDSQEVEDNLKIVPGRENSKGLRGGNARPAQETKR